MTNKPVTVEDLVKARQLAEKYHAGHMYGDKPYIYHLDAVERILINFGFGGNLVLLSAGRLHDIFENTSLDPESLSECGIPDSVIDVVCNVTDEPGVNRAERKRRTYPKIRASRRASIIKISDRIANVQAGDKIEMYRKEQKDFREGIYNEDFDLNFMWDYLELILQDN